MARVTVEVEGWEVLGELGDHDLIEEMESRGFPVGIGAGRAGLRNMLCAWADEIEAVCPKLSNLAWDIRAYAAGRLTIENERRASGARLIQEAA